jgi:hypothetical protein
LDNIKLNNKLSSSQIKGLYRLTQEIAAGAKINVSMFLRPTNFWSSYLCSIEYRTWSDLTFFEVEFLFYHAINSAVNYFDTGIDVFKKTKENALIYAMRENSHFVKLFSSRHCNDQLRLLTRLTANINAIDYSQIYVPSLVNLQLSRFLVDDTEMLLSELDGCSDRQLQYLADNAGIELLLDLIYIDKIISCCQVNIVVQFKPWPMFVSDALISDLDFTLLTMSLVDSHDEIYKVYERLSDSIASGRLQFKYHSNFGEPRHFSSLDSDLFDQLRFASVTISKGDLNYRRFIEDRCWPPQTSVEVASVVKTFSAYALRTLKSDAVVGIPTKSVEVLNQIEPEWRSNGRYVVISKIDAGGNHACCCCRKP